MSIVGVRFGRSGPVGYYDPGEVELSVGDLVVVETEDGPRQARVVISPNQVLYADVTGIAGRVLRKGEAS